MLGDAKSPTLLGRFSLALRRDYPIASERSAREKQIDTVVLSGGVFQNELLLHDVKTILASTALQIWTNHAVPPNDGGISLGQAALAAFERFDEASQNNTKSGAN